MSLRAATAVLLLLPGVAWGQLLGSKPWVPPWVKPEYSAPLGAELHFELIGAQIVSINPRSFAAQIGLRTNDRIQTIDRQDVRNLRGLDGLLLGAAPGVPRQMKVLRNLETHTALFTLANGQLVVTQPLPTPNGSAPAAYPVLFSQPLGCSLRFEPQGARVLAPQPGAFALQLGLQPDDLIATIDGRPVQSLDQMRTVVYGEAPKRPLLVTVLRNGQPVSAWLKVSDGRLVATLTAQPSNRPLPPELTGAIPAQASPLLGGDVRFEPQGIRVLTAPPGTLVARSGLQPGDVVQTIDGRLAYYPDQLRDLLSGRDGQTHNLVVQRGNQPLNTLLVNQGGQLLVLQPVQSGSVAVAPAAPQYPAYLPPTQVAGTWQPVAVEYFAELGLDLRFENGAARVVGVQARGLGQQLGLNPGDVIQSVAGRPTPDLAQMRQALATAPTWLPINVTVARNGQPLTASLSRAAGQLVAAQGLSSPTTLVAGTLDTRIPPTPVVPAPAAPPPGQLVSLKYSPGLGCQVRVEQGPVVKVAAVQPRTIAAYLGLAPGDWIESVNRRRITSMEEIEAVLAAMPGALVRIDVFRGTIRYQGFLRQVNGQWYVADVLRERE